MTDTYIRWLLIITGLFTAGSVGVFLQPVKQVALHSIPLRVPMMVLGVVEKIVLAGSI